MPSIDPTQLSLFRAIAGPPATLLLLLLVRGVSMTNLEMQRWTGFSDKTVTDSKDVLESLGFLQYNGRQHGWSLRQGYQGLLPLIHSLEGSVDKEIVNFTISPLTTTAATNGRENFSLEKSSSSSNLDRKFYDLDMSTRANGNGHHPHPIDERVADWLRRAGVGEKSRKYRELLAADLDWRLVRAHALDRLAQPEDISVGLFITRLLDRDPAPEIERCPRCYRPLDPYSGWCSGANIRLCDYYGGEEDEGE
jgi:hypothetical protein